MALRIWVDEACTPPPAHLMSVNIQHSHEDRDIQPPVDKAPGLGGRPGTPQRRCCRNNQRTVSSADVSRTSPAPAATQSETAPGNLAIRSCSRLEPALDRFRDMARHKLLRDAAPAAVSGAGTHHAWRGDRNTSER